MHPGQLTRTTDLLRLSRAGIPEGHSLNLNVAGGQRRGEPELPDSDSDLKETVARTHRGEPEPRNNCELRQNAQGKQPGARSPRGSFALRCGSRLASGSADQGVGHGGSDSERPGTRMRWSRRALQPALNSGILVKNACQHEENQDTTYGHCLPELNAMHKFNVSSVSAGPA